MLSAEVREGFADRLAAGVEERRSQLVLGLDPDPAALWPETLSEGPASDADDLAAATASAVAGHCRAVIEAVGPQCVAAKLQLACFERLGAAGWNAVGEVAAVAREHGLLVIADGKRGDVPATAQAYSEALVGETPGPFGPVRGLAADAFTVNPLLGRDALEPFVAAAGEARAGCFVLVRSSNPGASDVQDLTTSRGPVHEELARIVDDVGSTSIARCGLADVGAIVGATRPDRLPRLRELMPRAVFLMPGVGAQGGRIDALAPAFSHPAAGLVAASRSIVGTAAGPSADLRASAASAARELRAAAWSLATGSSL